MALIEFVSEAAIEEWLEETWDVEIPEWAFPPAPEGMELMRDEEGGPCAIVERQYRIDGASEDGQSAGVADLVITWGVGPADARVPSRQSRLIIEIKNCRIEPKDFEQIARYLCAERNYTKANPEELPTDLYGALIGPECSLQAGRVIAVSPWVSGFRIRLDPIHCGLISNDLPNPRNPFFHWHDDKPEDHVAKVVPLIAPEAS